MKKLFTIVCLLACVFAQAQKKRNVFEAVYPIGENPNIGYKTSMVNEETILFEANPFLRLSIINSMDRFTSTTPDNNLSLKNWAFAWYISYRPQLRMYTDESMPVRTPSCKISIAGFQFAKVIEPGTDKLRMLAFSFESGHFSNGQDRSAFSEDVKDGTKQNDSVYNRITDKTNLSKILNRSSGNFSTNYTEILANYKWFCKLDAKFRPMSAFSVQGGINIYHDKLLFVGPIGGYSDADIKIYGRNRFTAGVSYMWRPNKEDETRLNRFVVSVNTELIVKPHPSVEPWRVEATGTYFMHNNMGFFITASAGHDNYNYRFVDSGFQVFGGITFDIFPPGVLKL